MFEVDAAIRYSIIVMLLLLLSNLAEVDLSALAVLRNRILQIDIYLLTYLLLILEICQSCIA